jgi:hypothetical protein
VGYPAHEKSKDPEFQGWNAWKAVNQAGMDCNVSIRRDENTVMVSTQNQGIAISSVTVIKDDPDCIYAALTGDQVALTNIRISRTGTDDLSPSDP